MCLVCRRGSMATSRKGTVISGTDDRVDSVKHLGLGRVERELGPSNNRTPVLAGQQSSAMWNTL